MLTGRVVYRTQTVLVVEAFLLDLQLYFLPDIAFAIAKSFFLPCILYKHHCFLALIASV